MNKYFDIKDKVYDITERYPETIDIFVAHGFEQLKNETMRKLMGKTISLEMALLSKKVNVELFTQKLIDVIEQNRISEDSALAAPKKVDGGDIKIEGVLPCPVRIPLLEGFNQWMDDNRDKFDFTVDYELKSANVGVDWIKDAVIEAEKEEDLTDIFMSAGFDLFFDKKLMGKFKAQDIFQDLTGFDTMNKDFDNEEINLIDPDRQYSIIGVVPAVFLINKEELGEISMPETWEDLFKPEFEGRVSLPVGDFDLFNAILLNIYKVYGEEGIRNLGKAFSQNLSPAEMVKSHVKKNNRPMVTIMPYFFTKMIKEDGPMAAIWPKDGAIISPIFLLTKKSKKEKIQPFVDFFASKEVGEILSHNGRFPSTNPTVDNQIDKANKYMWLGWDYINTHDIGSLIIKCEEIFNESI